MFPQTTRYSRGVKLGSMHRHVPPGDTVPSAWKSFIPPLNQLQRPTIGSEPSTGATATAEGGNPAAKMNAAMKTNNLGFIGASDRNGGTESRRLIQSADISSNKSSEHALTARTISSCPTEGATRLRSSLRRRPILGIPLLLTRMALTQGLF